MGGFSQYDLKSILSHDPYFVYKIYAAILMNYYLVYNTWCVNYLWRELFSFCINKLKL